MASTPYPVPRGLRETGILLGDGASATYGPFGFAIFDAADVTVWTSDNAEAIWTRTNVVVTKLTDTPSAFFTVTFPAILPASMRFSVQAARWHERSVSVFRGGALVADELEKELSKQGSAVQELRRDINRAVRLPGGSGLADALLPPPKADWALGWNDEATRLINVISLAEIRAAADYADQVLDVVNQIRPLVPHIFPTRAAAEAYVFELAPDVIITASGGTPGDRNGRMFHKQTPNVQPLRGGLSVPLAGGGVQWYKSVLPNVRRWVKGNLGANEWIVLGAMAQSNGIGSAVGGDLTIDPGVMVWHDGLDPANPGTAAHIKVADPQAYPFNTGGQNNALFQAAKALRASEQTNVLILAAWRGGQSIERFEADNPNPELWNRVLTWQAALAAVGLDTVDRVWWALGETDSAMGIKVWQRKFEKVLAQCRAQAWWKKGHTYMLASEPTRHYLNSAQAHGLTLRMVAEKTADVAVISSVDLTTDPPFPIHFDSPGLDGLGKKIEEAVRLPYGRHPAPAYNRQVFASVNFTIDAAGGSGVDFTDIREAVRFFSTIRLSENGRASVKFGPGEWDLSVGLGLRMALREGSQWEFSGELNATPFVPPVKADISATAATALAYLKTKYLTQFKFPSTGLTLGGTSFGHWRDLMIHATASVNNSAAIQSRDNQIPKDSSVGRIRLSNVAIHGYSTTGASAIAMLDGSYCRASGLIISHCYIGKNAQDDSRIAAPGFSPSVPGTVFAHCTIDSNATGEGSIDSRFSTTTNTGTNNQATIGGRIDRRLAENPGSDISSPGGTIYS